MNRRIAHVLLLGGSLLASGAAFAQETAPADPAATPASAADEDVIVVTAQNRAENVQDVPIVIDVVGAEELRDAGFSSMNDVGKIAPVVQLNQDQGTVKVSVRGVGTTSNDEAQDTSVVINIDGEYLNRPNALGVALFDMERVEVLRGPQGTLYGRNSTGGAINFITRKPGKKFGFNASASYGNYDAIRLDAGVDVPLGEIGAARVSGFYEKRDGYVKHPASPGFFIFPTFNGGRSDDNKAYGGRASVRLEPTDQLTINLAAEIAKREFTPATFAFTDLNRPGNGPTGPTCNAPGYTQVAPAYTTANSLLLCAPTGTNFLSNINRGNYPAPRFGLGNIDQKTYALRGRVAYEFSDAATLSYIGGFRHFDQDSYLPLPVIYQSITFLDKADTHSHELRLNGVVGGVTYQIGGFYFKEKLDRENGFFIAPIGLPGGTFLSYFGRKIDSDSKSVFGQVEVPIMDTLTAVGGLRYTKNKRSATYINGSPFVMFDPTGTFPIGGPNFALLGAGPGRKDLDAINAQILRLGSKESKVTWLAGLNFKPNPDTLVYAKASTGFKGGGFDAIGTYKPETNLAFEAGWKQTFGERDQYQFNLSAFHYDYKDLQVSVLLDTAVGGQTFNAGKAKIWGLEASTELKLTKRDTFTASVNYLNAEYKELLAQFNVFCVDLNPADLIGCVNGIGDLDPVAPGVQQPDFAGNRPPFSPKFIVTAGYDHVFGLGSSGTLTASVNTTIKSSYFTDFFNYNDSKQKAYMQTDASLTYRPENEKFFVQGFVKNLENVRPLTYGSFISAGPDDIYNWQFGTPRLYGVRVGVDF